MLSDGCFCLRSGGLYVHYAASSSGRLEAIPIWAGQDSMIQDNDTAVITVHPA